MNLVKIPEGEIPRSKDSDIVDCIKLKKEVQLPIVKGHFIIFVLF